ncbi:MAG: hypothetical protein KAI47_10115 [Deltaproteobacteria bacterium]|nr:hypothetical protein [Deltaproteobacteria bacterium]
MRNIQPGGWPRWIALALAFVATGCLLDESIPPIDPNPPASCGNGVCDLQRETCTNCPKDCDCCAVVNAQGSFTEAGAVATAAAGQPDGVSVPIDDRSDLRLALGGDWNDQPVFGRDFEIHGKVFTNDMLHDELCPQGVGNGQGAFEVWVSPAGSVWRLVGLWTSKTNDFDLACAEASHIRWIRIKGQPGARGELDAVTAKGSACLK